MKWTIRDILDFMLTLAIAVASMMIVTRLARRSGEKLRKKFVDMGKLVGRPYTDFLEAVGKPMSEHVTTISDGQVVTVRQWQRMAFLAVLVFDQKDICIAISHDSSRRE